MFRNYRQVLEMFSRADQRKGARPLGKSHILGYDPDALEVGNILNQGIKPEMSVDVLNFRMAFRACRSELVSAGILSMFINLLFLTFPLYMMQIFTRVLSSRSVDTLVMLTLIAVAALVVFGVLTALRSRMSPGPGHGRYAD